MVRAYPRRRSPTLEVRYRSRARTLRRVRAPGGLAQRGAQRQPQAPALRAQHAPPARREPDQRPRRAAARRPRALGRAREHAAPARDRQASGAALGAAHRGREAAAAQDGGARAPQQPHRAARARGRPRRAGRAGARSRAAAGRAEAQQRRVVGAVGRRALLRVVGLDQPVQRPALDRRGHEPLGLPHDPALDLEPARAVGEVDRVDAERPAALPGDVHAPVDERRARDAARRDRALQPPHGADRRVIGRGGGGARCRRCSRRAGPRRSRSTAACRRARPRSTSPWGSRRGRA